MFENGAPARTWEAWLWWWGRGYSIESTFKTCLWFHQQVVPSLITQSLQKPSDSNSNNHLKSFFFFAQKAQVDFKSVSPPLVQMKDSRCNIEAKAGQGPEERNGLATDNCSPFILADWFFLRALLKGGLVVHPDWTADTNNTKAESNHSQRRERLSTGSKSMIDVFLSTCIFYQTSIVQTSLISSVCSDSGSL